MIALTLIESRMSTIDRPKALSEAIGTIVDEHWRKTGRMMLASTIGKRLRVNFPDFERIVTNGLINFLQIRPVVQIIEYPGMREKVGLLPLDVERPEDVTTLFEDSLRPEGREPEIGPPRPGFSDVFWKAFHRPLREPRFIVVDNSTRTFRITSTSKDIGENEKQFEITSADISQPPPSSTPSELAASTREKVDSWLKRHFLDEELFHRSRHRPLVPSTGIPNRSETSQSHVILRIASALEKLDDKDMARIQVPFDIVLKMI